MLFDCQLGIRSQLWRKVPERPTLYAMAMLSVIIGQLGPAGATEIWFVPIQPRPDLLEKLKKTSDPNGPLISSLEAAQENWDRMFTSPLPTAIVPPMQAYAINGGLVLGMADDELKSKLDQLSALNVKFVYEAQPVIVDHRGCGHSEGYEDVRNLNAAIAKLKRLHISVSYLDMDGGLFFAHYATGDQECRFSLDETIRRVGITVSAFGAAFPGIIIGDIEPTVSLTQNPDWEASFRAYKQGLEAQTGQRLAFLNLDIAWENPGWPTAVRAETKLARSLGMQVGYILNGDGNDATDMEWLEHARRNISEIEGGLNLVPDYALIATWNDHPKLSVGAPADETLASLMTYYAKPTIRLEIRRKSDPVSGVIHDGEGNLLQGFSVALEGIRGISLDPELQELHLVDKVPFQATQALIGLRFNMECFCAAANDLLIGSISYKEGKSDGETQNVDFFSVFQNLAGHLEAGKPFVQLLSGGRDGVARIKMTADESFGVTSRPFRVEPGDPFTMAVRVRDLLGSNVAGAITIIWENGAGQGFERDSLIIRPDYGVIQAVKSGRDGRFSFSLSSRELIDYTSLRVVAGDQNGHRGAIRALSDPDLLK